MNKLKELYKQKKEWLNDKDESSLTRTQKILLGLRACALVADHALYHSVTRPLFEKAVLKKMETTREEIDRFYANHHYDLSDEFEARMSLNHACVITNIAIFAAVFTIAPIVVSNKNNTEQPQTPKVVMKAQPFNTGAISTEHQRVN